MSLFPGPSNPIAYAQFHLAGGWKRASLISGVGALIMLVLIYVSQLDSGPHAAQHSMIAIRAWETGLLVVEALVLIVLGTFRVDSAVRADVSNRMIESHRLMPTPAVGAMFGYIAVAPVQLIMLAATAVLVGTGCCLRCGDDPGRYIVSAAVLAAYAVFLWAMVARFAFDVRGAFFVMLIAGVILLTNDGALIALMPAVVVLTNPIAGNLVIAARMTGPLPGPEYLVALLGQALVASVFIAAAARRYRSEESVGFSPLLGCLLVAIWSGLTIIGMSDKLDFVQARGFMHRAYVSDPDAFVASFTVAMALATVPIAAAARASGLWFRRGPTPSMPRRPVSAFVTTAAAALLIGSLLYIPRHDFTSFDFSGSGMQRRVWCTAAALGLYLTGITCLMQWVYLVSNRALVISVIWLAVTWIVPPIAAALLNSAIEDRDFNPVVAVSPVGMLALLWDRRSIQVTGGLLGQAAVTAVPVVLLLTRMTRAARLRNARATPADAVAL